VKKFISYNVQEIIGECYINHLVNNEHVKKSSMLLPGLSTCSCVP